MLVNIINSLAIKIIRQTFTQITNIHMNNIITFRYEIDGIRTGRSTAGSSGDYKPEVVINTLKEWYKKLHPRAKYINITIESVVEVSQKDYSKAQPGFLK